MFTNMNANIEKIAETNAANRTLAGLIAAHPFMKGISAQHLPVVADCAMQVQFDAGQLIFREGDLANRFYLIEQGKIALEARPKEGEPALIQTIDAGDVLGWSWLFPPYRWHFNACALEPVKAIFLYGTRLRERCEEDPSLGYDLMRRMAEVVVKRLQNTRRQLLEAKAKLG